MKQYLIDGNNVIGKDPELKSVQNRDPQASREKLAFKLDRFFSKKKFKVHLHFDGHSKEPIRTSKIRIHYSDNKTADEKIREQIEFAKNPKNLIVVTSDRALSEFAKVCSCQVKPSEALLRQIETESATEKEEEIIKEISIDEIKKIFGE